MAATCGSLQHIFDKPLSENPTLLESLSPWKQIKNMNQIQDSSCTEIFGELHFKENKVIESVESSSSSSPDVPAESSLWSSSSSSSFSADINQQNGIERLLENRDERSKSPTSSYYPTICQKKQYKHSDSFSSMNSESLSLCTEGLGFESSDDVEDLGNETSLVIQQQQQPAEERICFRRQAAQSDQISLCKESKRSRTSKGSFPPPISCIGRTGKPCVCFKSYRQDGRFILQEIRFPTQEFLHACREDGRLRLQFIQSDDEILEGDEEDDDDSEDVNQEKDGDDCDDEHEHHQNVADRRKFEENDAEKHVQIRTNNVQR